MPEPLNAETRTFIGEGWLNVLGEAFQTPGYALLADLIRSERAMHEVYPREQEVFSAFACTPFDQVKVVLVGQDPYHGPGQAHGLCFSVPPGERHPPSLRNLFLELERDLGIARPISGDLHPWAEQGVLLLNATLTVRRHAAGSHQGKGWETLTDLAISRLSQLHQGLIFLLWGTFAQRKEALIDASRHHILKTSHPSPLSAHLGFMGCGHFSLANELLMAQGQDPIDWRLP